MTNYTRLQILPVCAAFILTGTCVSTYVLAILFGHLNTGIAYISDVGTYPPESCFFGQFMNIGAVAMCLLVYVRHEQLMCQLPPYRPPVTLLYTALWTGFTSAFGVSMVANFQITKMETIHYAGALLAFGFAVAYFWIQTKCTMYDPPEKNSLKIIVIRSILATIASVFAVLSLLGSTMSYLSREGEARNDQNYHFGYEWFLIGTISEWMMALSLSAYIFSFVREFKDINLIIMIENIEENEKNTMETIDIEINKEKNISFGCIV